jgi:hypothetical protein
MRNKMIIKSKTFEQFAARMRGDLDGARGYMPKTVHGYISESVSHRPRQAALSMYMMTLNQFCFSSATQFRLVRAPTRSVRNTRQLRWRSKLEKKICCNPNASTNVERQLLHLAGESKR